jgi:hypothetical protein
LKMRAGALAVGVGIAIVTLLAACGQSAPAESGAAPAAGPTSAVEGATPVVGEVQGHFDPTEAVGQGSNSSSAVSDAASAFSSVQQASRLKIAANSSPPGATGGDVQTISIVAQDTGGVLKELDAAGKQNLGNSLLSAAASAWPNASISLLISDPNGAGGTIIGNHPKGGQNTVIAS